MAREWNSTSSTTGLQPRVLGSEPATPLSDDATYRRNTCTYVYMYVCVCVCTCMYVVIYIYHTDDAAYRSDIFTYMCNVYMCMCMYMYICIYIHTS